jgi:esterase/lipase superfamily enzyme
MPDITLYYATNRAHEGANQWAPKGYGNQFSTDGQENLRFGTVSIGAGEKEIQRHLNAQLSDSLGSGNGEKLATYLARCAQKASIVAYPEKLRRDVADIRQPNKKLGSQAMFADLQSQMTEGCDVLVYIHGFNVNWHDAVGAAAALQIMVNHLRPAGSVETRVMLFTWPSDGRALPFVSYKLDRADARGSGGAVGRGFLKLRDFLAALADRSRGGTAPCGHKLHLLCHSMGNYVLQHALARVDEYTPGKAMPRLFDQVCLCAPDIDDDELESASGMARVHEVARRVSLYYNREDTALFISDHTKGHRERLGSGGAARPQNLHHKLEQVDCTPVVNGISEHSYYLNGHVCADIAQTLAGLGADHEDRRRDRHPTLANVWTMRT